MSFLQPLRPWLSDFGIYGMAPWYQVRQFIVTPLGPLIAVIVLIAAQTHVRFDRQDGASAAIVLIKPAIHRMVALAVAAVVFTSVAAYKLAG